MSYRRPKAGLKKIPKNDSFFGFKPKCCDPFPAVPIFCGEADSTYCPTCGRWLESPVNLYQGKQYISKRSKRHSLKKCSEECY